jgi:hypothetical protein
VRPVALVQSAVRRFVDGTDEAFFACFHEDVGIYWEPAVSTQPLVSSRDALAEWVAQLRKEHPQLDATVSEPVEHGSGAVCELIVTREAEVWRVALGVCVSDGLIRELRAFWARSAAEAWVATFP